MNGLDKKWTAGVPGSFKNLSLQQVYKKSGKSKRKKHEKSHKKISAEELFKHFEMRDLSDLPTSFTWEEYLDPSVSQSECGSCYIISSVSMLNSRLRIKYGKDFEHKISMQYIINCSYYS